MLNEDDPAFDPNREVMGSRNLGRVATGFDAAATEMSKLGNGFFDSLSRVVGADSAAELFRHNVKITTDFQNRIEQADPEAAKIGKYGAIGGTAVLTTPIWGAGLPRSLISGVAGGVSSALADAGSNEDTPSEQTLTHALRYGTMAGLVGGTIGNAIIRGGDASSHAIKAALIRTFIPKVTPATSRSIEATAEAIDPNLITGDKK